MCLAGSDVEQIQVVVDVVSGDDMPGPVVRIAQWTVQINDPWTSRCVFRDCSRCTGLLVVGFVRVCSFGEQLPHVSVEYLQSHGNRFCGNVQALTNVEGEAGGCHACGVVESGVGHACTQVQAKLTQCCRPWIGVRVHGASVGPGADVDVSYAFVWVWQR